MKNVLVTVSACSQSPKYHSLGFYSKVESARRVIQVDGLRGLFGRGLKTRIIANGLQGLLFSVLWKLFLDL